MYLRLNNNYIPNHGYVVISDIGTSDDSALFCYTGYTVGNDHKSEGMWLAPNSTQVGSATVSHFRVTSDQGAIGLVRNNGHAPLEGIYVCDINLKSGKTHQIYVGLYNQGEGNK